jgi:hypothetical protein
MAKWEQYDMESKIKEVLSDVRFDPAHHFRRPFLTPYQIAIELTYRHPTICEDLGMELGGAGTGLENSLTQYIAQRLSARIKSGDIRNIEGAFISSMHLTDMVFKDSEDLEIHSSNTDQDTLSMFRLRQV